MLLNLPMSRRLAPVAAGPRLGVRHLAAPLLGASLAWCVLPAPSAHAAEAPDATTLETLVVTARKREENLQTTPISITALSGAALQERQVANTEGLGQIAPNLIVSQGQGVSGNSSAGAYFIRGIGQIDFLLNTDPGVGVYLDGVYIARSLGSLMDIVDLERVEVLRGPQGTLFGRNTIGGAINLVSRAPTSSFTANAQATLGSFDRHEARLTVSGPLSDQLSATGAVLLRERSGWVRRITDDTTLGDDNSFSGRLGLRWKPRDTLTVDLGLDYTDQHGTSPPANIVQAVETANFPSFHNGALVGPPCVPPPGSRTNPACFNSQWVARDLFREQGTGPSGQKLKVFGASLNAAWEIAPDLTVRSITGYRKTDAFGSRDGDHTPILIQDTVDTYTHKQFSQELQLLGAQFDHRLHWILGAYYFSEQGENLNFVTFPVVALRSGGSVDNNNTALFGQATLDITSQLSLTAGLRRTEETKRFLPDQIVLADPTHAFPPGSVPGFRIVPFTRSSRSIHDTTPMADLAYRWTDGFMTYASYSEGFKSGGFTQRIFPPLPAPPAFDPEFAKAYEAGFKFETQDHRFRVNGAAYRTDYSNLQVQVLVGVQPLTANAAGAEIKGFELEFDARPIPDLRIDGGLGQTEAKYTSLGASVLATGVTLDKRFAQVPEWTGNLGVSYVLRPAFGGVLRPRVDVSYRSAAFMNAANTPSLRQPAYALVNASVRYESANERWGVTVFGENLTDRTYINGGFADLTDQGYAEAQIGRPREWGVSVNYRY